MEHGLCSNQRSNNTRVIIFIEDVKMLDFHWTLNSWKQQTKRRKQQRNICKPRSNIVVAKYKKKEKKVKAIQDLVNKYEYCKFKFSHATG